MRYQIFGLNWHSKPDILSAESAARATNTKLTNKISYLCDLDI